MIYPNLIKILVANYIRGLGLKEVMQWRSGENVQFGTVRLWKNKKYISKFAGRCGDSAPIHTNGEATDGKVTWIFVEDISGIYPIIKNSYLLFGSFKTDYLNDAFYAQRLNSENARVGVRCVKWVDGAEFDADINKLIRNTKNDIYICVRRGVGQSTKEPTETHDYNFQTLDGYIWRYVVSIPQIYDRFISEFYVPLLNFEVGTESYFYDTQLLYQSGEFTTPICKQSNAVNIELRPNKQISTVWVSGKDSTIKHNDILVVQNQGAKGENATATANIENGKIASVNVDTTGIDYEHVTVLVHGDGSGCTLSATLDGIGAVTSITVDAAGDGYTYANVYVIAGEAGALVKALSLKDGVNSILNLESNANALIINTNVQTKNGYINASGKNSKYDYLAIATALVELGGEYANKQHYILPQNANYNTETLNKLAPVGMVICSEKFESKQRTNGQEESITFIVKMD